MRFVQILLVMLVSHGRIDLMLKDEREMLLHLLRLLLVQILRIAHFEEALQPKDKVTACQTILPTETELRQIAKRAIAFAFSD